MNETEEESFTNIENLKIYEQNKLMNQEFINLDSDNLENRIMLVDDEEFCLSTMNSMLFNIGVDTKKRVDFCISGHEALKRL